MSGGTGAIHDDTLRDIKEDKCGIGKTFIHYMLCF